jgi:hypothetical protein
MNENTDQIPTREHLCKLQMLRTTLVRLLNLGDQLDDVCNGCLVRVLLEIKGDVVEASSNDYHVAVLRGIRRGMSYSGFTWDHIQTDIHFVIELPPVVRTTPQGNHVQLNSISNSPIRESEYNLWVQQMVHSRALIITPSQVDLRVVLLEQQMRSLGVAGALKAKRRRTNTSGQKPPVDPTVKAAQKQKFEETKARVSEEYKVRYSLYPAVKDLVKLSRDDMLAIETRLVGTLEAVRATLKEKSKCRLCQREKCSVICYPCKHQVMCPGCSVNVTVCPAPGCGAHIEDKIQPFVV